jgi:LuxR family maltose regulon positive regulatory protein
VRAEAGGRSGRLIEILGLMAVALNGQGKSDEAAAALSQALFLAQPQGYRRLFLDMGRPLSEVLQLLVGQHTISQPTEFTQVYERELLNTFLQEETARRELAVEPAFASRAPAEPMLSALTDRELEVLQLLAEGLSNKQIAAKLVVAPSTVKQHLKNIYSKLDVHSRTQAVARGVELNLL